MLFFKVRRTFWLENLKDASNFNRLRFDKGNTYIVEQLKDGDLGSFCDNTSVNSKAYWLMKNGWIDNTDVPNVSIQDLINHKILDCLMREC